MKHHHQYIEEPCDALRKELLADTETQSSTALRGANPLGQRHLLSSGDLW